jgi:hypothetical protein
VNESVHDRLFFILRTDFVGHGLSFSGFEYSILVKDKVLKLSLGGTPLRLE